MTERQLHAFLTTGSILFAIVILLILFGTGCCSTMRPDQRISINHFRVSQGLDTLLDTK